MKSITAGAQSQVIADIQNIRNDNGNCKVCLFDKEDSFNGKSGTAFKCATVPIKNKKARATFTNIPAGIYAISVFHDANDNNKLDQNFIGIPKEGYGASKNKLPFASAPTFKENQFFVTANSSVSMTISLRNL